MSNTRYLRYTLTFMLLVLFFLLLLGLEKTLADPLNPHWTFVFFWWALLPSVSITCFIYLGLSWVWLPKSWQPFIAEIIETKRQIQAKTKHRWWHRKTQPIALILGPQGSGKSTLLTQIGLTPMTTDATTNNLMLWQSSDGMVFLEVREPFFCHAHKMKARFLWWILLLYFRRHWHKDNIYCVLAAPIIADQTYPIPPHKTEALKRALQTIGQFIRGFQLRIILTGLDKIKGFHIFFAASSPEEIRSAWRMTLPQYKGDIQPVFEKAYGLFLEKLNTKMNQRIQPLGFDKDIRLIREFPLQIGQLFPFLEQIIAAILPDHAVSLRDLHWTANPSKEEASTQSTHCRSYDLLHELLTGLPEPQETATERPDEHNTPAYFSHTFLRSSALLLQHSWQDRWQFSWWGLWGCCFISACLLLHHSSTRLLTPMQNLQAIAAQKPSQENISTLSHLIHTVEQNIALLKNNSPMLALYDTPLHQALTKGLSETIRKSSQHYRYQLMQTLEERLKEPEAENPEELLNLYLMLAGHTRTNPEVLYDWFQKTWSQEISRQELPKQVHALNTMLAYQSKTEQGLSWLAPHFGVDQALIDKQHAIFKKRPIQRKILDQIVLNWHSKHPKRTPWSRQYPSMPSIYTAKAYDQLMSKIPKACARWHQEKHLKTPLKNCIATTQNRYLKSYSNYWQNAYTTWPVDDMNALHVRLKKWSEDPQWRQQKEALIQQAWQRVRDDKTLATSWHKKAVNAAQTSDTTHLNKALANLSSQLEAWQNHPDPSQAAYQWVRKRYEGKDDVFSRLNALPPALKTKYHITELYHGLWHALLLDAAKPVEQAWAQLKKQQKNTLKNCYPFNFKSNADCAVEDVQKIFGPQGRMDQFVTRNLAPWIDRGLGAWQIKKLDGQSMILKEKTKHFLEKADAFRAHFFQNGQLTVSHFIAIDAEHSSSDFIQAQFGDHALKTLEQTLHKASYTLDWRFSKDNPSIYLGLAQDSGPMITWSFYGPWSWLRMLLAASWTQHAKDDLSQIILTQGDQTLSLWINHPQALTQLLDIFSLNIPDTSIINRQAMQKNKAL